MTPTGHDKPIGLIAGQGRLPLLVAQGVRAAGRDVACVGLAGQYDPQLPGLCQHFAKAGIIQLGRWTRLMQRWAVHDAVMIGRVRKANMYQPWRLLRQIPDWRAVNLWYRVLRHDKRNAAVLSAVANELALGGIHLIDTTSYLQEHLAHTGVMGHTQPTQSQLADIEFAWPIVARMNDLDIGQAVAVKEREVIAVEAIEGTDAMIQRAGELCPVGGWTLVKAAKAKQDMRFDVPTIGPTTIENLHRHGGRCLVVQAGKVILADKPKLLQLADQHRVCVIGR